MYRYDVEHVISQIIIHLVSLRCVYLGSRTTSVFSFALITVRLSYTYLYVRARVRVFVYTIARKVIRWSMNTLTTYLARSHHPRPVISALYTF